MDLRRRKINNLLKAIESFHSQTFVQWVALGRWRVMCLFNAVWYCVVERMGHFTNLLWCLAAALFWILPNFTNFGFEFWDFSVCLAMIHLFYCFLAGCKQQAVLTQQGRTGARGTGNFPGVPGQRKRKRNRWKSSALPSFPKKGHHVHGWRIYV